MLLPFHILSIEEDNSISGTKPISPGSTKLIIPTSQLELPLFRVGEDSSQGDTGGNKQSQIPPDSRRCRASVRAGRKHCKRLISRFTPFIERVKTNKT